jgi:hypothetical protein
MASARKPRRNLSVDLCAVCALPPESPLCDLGLVARDIVERAVTATATHVAAAEALQISYRTLTRILASPSYATRSQLTASRIIVKRPSKSGNDQNARTTMSRPQVARKAKTPKIVALSE